MNKKQIVALSIEKVQTFLTETIHAHVQEKETDEATLRSIIKASREISIDFYKTIKDVFSDTDITELLACSGVYIFSCVLLADDIEARLNQLFLHYYHGSQGQKLLRCTTFPENGLDPIQAIQEAKKRLKQDQCMNERIEKNKQNLFSFYEFDGKRVDRIQDNTGYPMFAKNINALFSEEISDNEKHFRIAVIKADLDGMGDMFKQIDDYKVYSAISKILNDEISLEGLNKCSMAVYMPTERPGWLFPFYIAGDDIFFAVNVSDLRRGVEVCRRILLNINHQL